MNELHERLCRACGAPVGGGISLPPASSSMVRAGLVIRHGGLQWRWVVLGTLVTLGICGIAAAATVAVAASATLRGVAEDEGAAESLLVTAGCGFLLGFFLGGVLVGRMSKGRTIVEPGLSAVLAALVLLGLAGVLDRGLTPLLCATPVLALLSLVGAWLGEKWQGAQDPSGS